MANFTDTLLQRLVALEERIDIRPSKKRVSSLRMEEHFYVSVAVLPKMVIPQIRVCGPKFGRITARY